jgi:hypothetical protein
MLLMRTFLIYSFCFLFFVDVKAQLISGDSNYKIGEVMVMLHHGVSINKILESPSSRKESSKLAIKEILSKDLNIYLLDFDASKISNYEVLKSLLSLKEVALAQNNHFISKRTKTPNDTYFTSMWDMNNTGQSGIADSDIDAIEAWEISTGGMTSTGDTIVVAVLDAGFYLQHEDINFWKNYKEIPANSIDDDSNGYVDDYNGWNAINNNGNISSDDHGTHVSGTVGAIGNNNKGVTGVNWNVKVMAIEGSTELESEAVRGYTYVYKQRKLYNESNGLQGTFVVSTNASFGVDYGKPANYPLWCAIYDTCGKAGILSAGATANLNIDIDVKSDIPTACPSDYLISVTNTNSSDVKYSGAAYGAKTIDIGAPGTGIWSTLPGNVYGGNSWTGTSMASPHVAGAVALMISAASPALISQYKLYPDSFAKIFKDWMLCSADPNTSLTNKTVSNGRLNLFGALSKVQDEIVCGLTSSANNKVGVNFKTDLFKVYPAITSGLLGIEYSLSNTKPYRLEIYDQLGRKVKTINRNSTYEGKHQHTIDVSDLEQGIYIIKLVTSDSEAGAVRFFKE